MTLSFKSFRGKIPEWYKIKEAQKTQIDRKDWNFFPGDVVRVVSGKFKGKEGGVRRIMVNKNQVIVNGVNLRAISRSQKDIAASLNKYPKSRIFMVPFPITASDVRLVERETGRLADVTMIKGNKNKGRIDNRTGKKMLIKHTNLSYKERINSKPLSWKDSKKKVTTAHSFKGINFDYIARQFTRRIKTKEKVEALMVMRDSRE